MGQSIQHTSWHKGECWLERGDVTTSIEQVHRLYAAILEHSSDLVSILDTDGTYLYVSPSHYHILGYRPEDLHGQNALALIAPEDRARVQGLFAARAQRPGTTGTTECRVQHADGSWRTLELIGNNRLTDPAVRGIIINGRDITARKRIEEELQHQALHDGLTGLPNRVLLQDRLQQAIRVARRDRHALAFLLLDLDRFKEVNDTFGHQHGDLLLQQIGPRLHGVLRASDTVARLGGDEFGVLLSVADETSALRAVRKILATLDEPFVVEGEHLHAGASIGVVLYPAHGDDAPALLRRADVAMYVAKRARSGYAVYMPEQDEYSPDRLAFVGALRRAIADHELLLHYQPKAHVATGRINDVEALVRWQHPQQGLIPPDRFIPLAEQMGLIVPLTRWVLEEALRQWQAWRQAGHPFNVEVNLSMWNLHDPHLVETVTHLLARYQAPAGTLCLELTESALMADAAHALDVLTRLSLEGVRVAIDDFGTGYSSLAYLKRLPVDELKIDRSFVMHMARDETDAAIVTAIINLGHSLGLHVVAEGVENSATWDALASLKCDQAQGYYLSQPLPAAALEQWLAASH